METRKVRVKVIMLPTEGCLTLKLIEYSLKSSLKKTYKIKAKH